MTHGTQDNCSPSINSFIRSVISHRVHILDALQADIENLDLQTELEKWRSGSSAGLSPDGATIQILKSLNEMKNERHELYLNALASCADFPLGTLLASRIQEIFVEHSSLYANARRAFEASDQIPNNIGEHGRLVQFLIDLYKSIGKDTSIVTEVGAIRASADFKSIRCGGQIFEFTNNQRVVIGALVKAYWHGTPVLSKEYLLELIDHEAPPARMDAVFRDHPAWKTLVVPGGTRGSLQLAPSLE